MCKQTCLCLSIMCEREKTSYQLQTTQEDEHASRRAAAHLLPLSAPAGSVVDDDVNNNREVTGFKKNTQTQEPDLRSFRSIARRARCTLPQEENT